MSAVLVTGAGGFCAGHLVRFLLDWGHEVRATDIKPKEDWWQWHDDAHNLPGDDLTDMDDVRDAVREMEYVYNLAEEMGGIGWISEQLADCAFSIQIAMNMLRASRDSGIERFMQVSSACVYPQFLQGETGIFGGLRESDAWPALPEEGYGLAKLFGEKLCEYATTDWGLETRVVRPHNIYGPHGTWDGGKEKAPAALARKIATAKLINAPSIEIWGDGEQTRSFCFVSDFCEGIIRVMESDYPRPVNLGSSELVTINQLADLICDIADYHPEREYIRDAPMGVRGRNSDNTLIRDITGWEPSTGLRQGLIPTYEWVEAEVRKTL